MLRKTPFALRFLREWLSWATSGEHITDAWDPARQYSAFREHRHDQSILSLLAKRHRLKTFPLPTAAHDRRDIWAWHHVTKKLAHTSASWLSGGFSQRLILLQAAPCLGQPRPNSRLGRAGRPAISSLFVFTWRRTATRESAAASCGEAAREAREA